MRPELSPLPTRMLTLSVDERGYPIPWFVDYVDGKPEFRAMNVEKWIQAIKFKMCWVCGHRLGRWMTFVAGPMCGINRTTSEPPNHLECAQWSALNCPFLNNPEAIRRVDERVGLDGKAIGGFAIQRNPGVAMLWTCKDYSVFPDEMGGRLIHMGEPERVEWYAHGRLATREEVLFSVNTGLPPLMDMASKQEGGIKFLAELHERFQKWLPEEKASVSGASESSPST